MSVWAAAEVLARDLAVDERHDLVRWGGDRRTGLHDYAGLYAVPGLYEAVYYLALGGRSPALLAAALAEAVPPQRREQLPVLDVGAGTGTVGEALWDLGFRRISGTDLEPASTAALRRDRPDVYARSRTMDLAAPGEEDLRWLAGVAPEVVTVAGAVGFGHLPAEAFRTLTRLLPAGALLAVAVAPDLADDPALAGHAELLLGRCWEQVARSDGVHRTGADGPLRVAALVLRRTGADL